uniref:PDZ domain-containing protein n=1 Tax=Stomoxys calcitrans TaxID=35570 RepID=A0A1I8NQR4_STOCA
MVIDIKMCRFENVPWGFSLVGGADFEYPLTVVKVTEGSIAEEAGLMVGDVIVRINDTAVSPLTHEESHRVITGCGSVFFLGVQRENEEQYLQLQCFPTTTNGGISTPKTFLDVTAQPPASRNGVDVPELLVTATDNVVEMRAASPLPQLAVEHHSEYECEDDTHTPKEPLQFQAVSEHISAPLDFAEQSIVAEESKVLYMPELEERPCSVLSENSERKLVEDEIAAVLSGETEILKEHNTLGLFPKPGVCMSSDVLRTLNEEATKTKLEKEQENRRWTTFLQKPNRPIPKSKQQLEAERRAANAYKVKIVKSAPRSRSVTPVPPEPQKEPTPPPVQPEPEPEPEPELDTEAPTPIDSEVPNLEEVPKDENAEDEAENMTSDAKVEEKSDKEKELTPEAKEVEESNNHQSENPEMETNMPEVLEVVVAKTEEELALERQLADVQRQLAALSCLPSTIQSTLDAVTRQLADLLPTFKLQEEKQRTPEAREISLEAVDEQSNNEDDKNTDIKQNDNEAENCHESEEKRASQNAVSQQLELDNKANEQIANDTNEARDTIDKNPIKQQEVTTTSTYSMAEETQQMEDEQKLKKQKDNKHDVIGELEEHLERKSNPKRSKRAFGPLTPASDRPLVLPGGRRWYRPKDAYNDEFIAETLSAQAELITGSTLGVNFMKYQKPEKKIDLNRSEVYKVVHHLDRQPMRGIEVRAPIVPSEMDIRNAAHSS